METNDNKSWYAVHTRPRWEKKISRMLDEKGIENYCPLNIVIRQWSDRKKKVEEPVFRSYVFVRIEEKKMWDVKQIDGILNYVYWLGKPARIKQSEIDTVKKFLNEFTDVSVEKLDLSLFDKVKIRQGDFMDYEGMVVRLYNNRVVVKLETMGIQLTADFHRKNVEVSR